MARINLFADESGNFDFSRSLGATKYFILTTLCTHDCSVGEPMLELRRTLVCEGVLKPTEQFHATDNSWPVRNRVFELLKEHDFRIDATILEKSKAQPHIRPDDVRFYKHAWFYHMRSIVPRVLPRGDQLFVVSASLGTKAKGTAMYEAVHDVANQTAKGVKTACWPAASDPCLQAVDYCCWAIARKWERGDATQYELIKDKIEREYDLWAHGGVHHY